MAGRDLLVDRVVNGMRTTRYEERIPDGMRFVVEEEDDHIHITIGSEEELASVGVVLDDEPKPKPARKSAAKK